MHIYFSPSVRESSFLSSRSLGAAVEEVAASDPPPSPHYDPAVDILARSLARARRDSSSCATVASDLTYYMDVGVWGLGSSGRTTTSFGLVSGPDFLLCSWMNHAENGAAFRATSGAGGRAYAFECPGTLAVQQWWSSLAAGARSFLEQAHGMSPSRGFVLAAARAAANFTDPQQAVLVLPDLHLRLRNGRPLDLFLYRRGDSTVSLDGELANLLSLARRLGATTAQAGDMYETWESEILCRLQHVDLFEHLSSYFRLAGEDDPMGGLRSDFRYMLQNHRTLLAMLNSDMSWQDWQDRHASPVDVHQIQRDSVDFTSVESLEAGIRAAHPDLFSGRTNLTDHDVHGNHDNNHPNRYWSRSYVHDDYRSRSQLTPGTQPSSQDRRPDHVRLGQNDCLWIEHGHRYDWHNNDVRWSASDYGHWYQDDHGFDLVEQMVRHARNHQSWVDWMRGGGDFVTDLLDYEMRHFTLLRVDDLLRNERGVAGVIMGHTHEPCLLEVPRGTSYFWLHPHASQYLGSDNCLAQAAAIARALPH